MRIQRVRADNFALWRDQIAELFNESAKINFSDFIFSDSYGHDKCNEVSAFLEDGSAIVFVAAEQDILKGWVWCHRFNRLGRTRLHIAEIAVFEQYRKHGIGNALLKKVEDYAKDNSYCEIELFVTADNTSAVTFYKNASYLAERYLMKKEIERDKHSC